MDSPTFDRIAFVSRRDDDKEAGYQRYLSQQRAAGIARYIDRKDGCIPNSILVNLEEGATYDRRTQTLPIPDQPKPAWVIDGQHRMFGLGQAITTYDLVITAFLGIVLFYQAPDEVRHPFSWGTSVRCDAHKRPSTRFAQENEARGKNTPKCGGTTTA